MEDEKTASLLLRLYFGVEALGLKLKVLNPKPFTYIVYLVSERYKFTFMITPGRP